MSLESILPGVLAEPIVLVRRGWRPSHQPDPAFCAEARSLPAMQESCLWTSLPNTLNLNLKLHLTDHMIEYSLEAPILCVPYVRPICISSKWSRLPLYNSEKASICWLSSAPHHCCAPSLLHPGAAPKSQLPLAQLCVQLAYVSKINLCNQTEWQTDHR